MQLAHTAAAALTFNPPQAVVCTKTNWALTCWATTKGTQGLIQHRISNFGTLVLPDEKKEFTASALLETHGDNLN